MSTTPLRTNGSSGSVSLGSEYPDSGLAERNASLSPLRSEAYLAIAEANLECGSLLPLWGRELAPIDLNPGTQATAASCLTESGGKPHALQTGRDDNVLDRFVSFASSC